MTRKEPITAERLREILAYDPETGVFTWLARSVRHGTKFLHEDLRWNTRYAGKQAGNTAGNGYVCIDICTRAYKAHRLAWLYVTGSWPSLTIDHRNGVRSDNRLANLREATKPEQGQNRKLNANNISGHTGVCFHRQHKKWRAKINGKWLGYFNARNEAIDAYLAAKAEEHIFQPVLRET